MEVNLKLEQDEMEGVDEREWVSIVLININMYLNTNWRNLTWERFTWDH